jgi:two-component system C4-dicarboxylate transport response regulator DctD
MTDRPATRVLFVDDDRDVRTANLQTLKGAGIDAIAYSTADGALRDLSWDFAGAVITDLRMPQLDGRQLMARVSAIDPDIPVIIITGHGEIADAVDAMKEGAYDFIAKPYPAERLIGSVQRAIEKRNLVLENRQLRTALGRGEETLPLLGTSPAISALNAMLRNAAQADVDVLVEGEAGVGKESVARALHAWGRRRKAPFAIVHCAGLNAQALDAELFGREVPSPSPALRRQAGQLSAAEPGMLYLTDIDTAPAEIQARLLHVLDDRTMSVPGSVERRGLDVRMVASTTVDIDSLAASDRFRRDLFYRLSVVRVRMPALRERRPDIPLLFSYFVEKAASRFRRAAPTVSDFVLQRLMQHGWPGNLRELQHFAERVALGFERHVPSNGSGTTDSLPKRVENFEANVIRDALATTHGDVRAAIEMLQIPRKTFYDKLNRHGIRIDEFRLDSGLSTREPAP